MTLNEASRDYGGMAATLETLVGRRAVLELSLVHVRTRNDPLIEYASNPPISVCPYPSFTASTVLITFLLAPWTRFWAYLLAHWRSTSTK